MLLQIYIPARRTEEWLRDPRDMTWEDFQTAVVEAAGGISISRETGVWKGKDGHVQEPIVRVDALIRMNDHVAYRDTWGLLRDYALQLVRRGEESVLIVQGGEPTFITRAT